MNVSEELTRLAQLRDDGVLTDAEFERQKAKVLGATPPRAAQPVSRASRNGIGCAVIIIVVLAIVWLGGSGKDKPAASVTAEAPIDVAAADIARAYDDNELSAKSLYGDRAVRVSGKIARIGTDIVNSPYLALEGSNRFDGPTLYFDEDAGSRIAGLSKGETVTATCQKNGKTLNMTVLRECAF